MSAEVFDLQAARAARGRVEGTEPWVTTDRVAEHFSRSTRTIQRWVDRGMPSKKYGVRLFKLSWCERWLEEQA